MSTGTNIVGREVTVSRARRREERDGARRDDLVGPPGEEILLIDINEEKLNKAATKLRNPPKLKTLKRNITARHKLIESLKGYDVVGIALPRWLNVKAIWGAIEAGINAVDLSEPAQKDWTEINKAAKKADVTIIPGEVAATARILDIPRAAAAPRSVAPEVTTSSTSTTRPATRRRSRNAGGARSSRGRAAWRGHHSGAARSSPKQAMQFGPLTMSFPSVISISPSGEGNSP